MPLKFKKHTPNTLEEAVDLIVAHLDAEEREAIRESDPVEFHHLIGREMRNEWQLWHADAPLARHFAQRFNLTHADDISSIILSSVSANVKGEMYDPYADAIMYQAHWEQNS
jgi:hypothetical protein